MTHSTKSLESIESAARDRRDAHLLCGLFQSFFLGGFECSSHRRDRPDGPRLDLLASTQHDRFAHQDYLALRRLGIHTVRDGIRWHRIERIPGHYDFADDRPMLDAARETGTQVIWDICHYGWPDDLDPFTPEFARRLAGLARAFVRMLVNEGVERPCLVPFNEISFVAWIGGSKGRFPPFAVDRGDELKRSLVRATIECIEAIREVAPRARICLVDPMIHIAGPRRRPDLCREAEQYCQVQYAAWDMIAGRLAPELGGRPEYLDVIGVNYYVHNQWVHEPPREPPRLLRPGDASYRPVSDLLADIYHRYGRPLFIAETGIEGRMRPRWLRQISEQVRTAIERGVPVEGVCIYPVVDYPGWADDRHCPTGLLGYPDERGRRPVCRAFAREVRRQQELLADLPIACHCAA